MSNYIWITEFLKDKEVLSGLKDLIPDRFDTYSLIPWSVGIIDDFPFSDYPNDNDTIEDLNKQHAIQKNFGIFLNNNTEDKYRTITLKELSERFNVTHCADTVSLIKSTPGISFILKPTIQKLTKLLNVLKGDNSLNLYVADSFRFEVGYDHWKFRTENSIPDLTEYMVFQQGSSWDSTSYLFPEDLNWCLCTVEDFQHFILCSNNSSYDRIREIKELEIFLINYDFTFDRVDYQQK